MNKKYCLVQESLAVVSEDWKDILPEARQAAANKNAIELDKQQMTAMFQSAQDAIKTGAMGLGVVALALTFGAGLLVSIVWAFKKIFSKAKTPEQKEQMKEQAIQKIEAAKQKALANPKNVKKQAQIIANAAKVQNQIKSM
jgi:hypothetical protein